LAQGSRSKRIAHEDYSGTRISIVCGIHANKFDIVSANSASLKIVVGLLAESLSDLDAEGLFCFHPTCREHSSTQASAKVNKHVFTSQVDELEEMEDLAVRRWGIMHLPVIILRSAATGVVADGPDAEPPVPEFIVRVEETGLIALSSEVIK
jgi:hypothetical protein